MAAQKLPLIKLERFTVARARAIMNTQMSPGDNCLVGKTCKLDTTEQDSRTTRSPSTLENSETVALPPGDCKTAKLVPDTFPNVDTLSDHQPVRMASTSSMATVGSNNSSAIRDNSPLTIDAETGVDRSGESCSEEVQRMLQSVSEMSCTALAKVACGDSLPGDEQAPNRVLAVDEVESEFAHRSASIGPLPSSCQGQPNQTPSGCLPEQAGNAHVDWLANQDITGSSLATRRGDESGDWLEQVSCAATDDQELVLPGSEQDLHFCAVDTVSHEEADKQTQQADRRTETEDFAQDYTSISEEQRTLKPTSVTSEHHLSEVESTAHMDSTAKMSPASVSVDHALEGGTEVEVDRTSLKFSLSHSRPAAEDVQGAAQPTAQSAGQNRGEADYHEMVIDTSSTDSQLQQNYDGRATEEDKVGSKAAGSAVHKDAASSMVDVQHEGISADLMDVQETAADNSRSTDTTKRLGLAVQTSGTGGGESLGLAVQASSTGDGKRCAHAENSVADVKETVLDVPVEDGPSNSGVSRVRTEPKKVEDTGVAPVGKHLLAKAGEMVGVTEVNKAVDLSVQERQRASDEEDVPKVTIVSRATQTIVDSKWYNDEKLKQLVEAAASASLKELVIGDQSWACLKKVAEQTAILWATMQGQVKQIYDLTQANERLRQAKEAAERNLGRCNAECNQKKTELSIVWAKDRILLQQVQNQQSRELGLSQYCQQLTGEIADLKSQLRDAQTGLRMRDHQIQALQCARAPVTNLVSSQLATTQISHVAAPLGVRPPAPLVGTSAAPLFLPKPAPPIIPPDASPILPPAISPMTPLATFQVIAPSSHEQTVPSAVAQLPQSSVRSLAQISSPDHPEQVSLAAPAVYPKAQKRPLPSLAQLPTHSPLLNEPSFTAKTSPQVVQCSIANSELQPQKVPSDETPAQVGTTLVKKGCPKLTSLPMQKGAKSTTTDSPAEDSSPEIIYVKAPSGTTGKVSRPGQTRVQGLSDGINATSGESAARVSRKRRESGPPSATDQPAKKRRQTEKQNIDDTSLSEAQRKRLNTAPESVTPAQTSLQPQQKGNTDSVEEARATQVHVLQKSNVARTSNTAPPLPLGKTSSSQAPPTANMPAKQPAKQSADQPSTHTHTNVLASTETRTDRPERTRARMEQMASTSETHQKKPSLGNGTQSSQSPPAVIDAADSVIEGELPTLQLTNASEKNLPALKWFFTSSKHSHIDRQIKGYVLFARKRIQDTPPAPPPGGWICVGDQGALKTPVRCKLKWLGEGHPYHFAVRYELQDGRSSKFSNIVDLP